MLRRLRAAAFGQPAPADRTIKVFDTYADALDHCGGYEEADLLEVIAAKTKVVRDDPAALGSTVSESDVHSLLALTMSALAASGSALKVLDFGGACGAHYYHLRRLVPLRQLRWAIVETPGMAGCANRLAAGDTNLSAFTSVADALRALDGTVDLVHASGSLQCTPDPYAALDALLGIRAPILLLTRGAVTTGNRDLVVIHESSLASNGPGPLPPQFQDRPVSYPFLFASRDRVLAALGRVYRRVLLLPDRTGYVPVNHEPVDGFAALCSEPW